MRFLVVDSEGGMGLDIAQRAAIAGHQVQLFLDSLRPVGQGFQGVKRVDDLKAALQWVGKDGLVFPTGNSKYTATLDRYREVGFRVFGPTVASAKLEIDRGYGMEVMRSAGLDLPHYEVFDTLEDAEAFARKADQSYVLKPMGSCDDKACTYVSHSPADMVGWIQRKRVANWNPGGPVMLQEKIDLCCEIGASGWFGPDGFLPEKQTVFFEHKKFLAGNKGPASGEEGTVQVYLKSDKLFDEALFPLATALQALGHRGDFAVGGALDTKGKFWPFEMTCRQGWPSTFLQTAAHKGDPIQWMSSLLDGDDTLRVDYRPTIGVVLSIPPYPQWNGAMEKVCGNPIEGLDGIWKNVHPAMMMIGRGPYMSGDKVLEGKICQTAGELPMVVTSLGDTVSEAKTAVYDKISKIRISDLQFRVDIGSDLERQLPDIHKAGYAQGIEWGDDE